MNGDKPTSILVVDDDEDITAFIYGQLEPQGFVLDSAGTGELGLELALENEYDIIILDLMLPGADGLTVCREVRATFKNPILMLTARTDDMDQVLGLEMGADDYLAKPVDLRELLARIQAVLRRGERRREDADATPASAPMLVKFGDCTLDTGAHRLSGADGEDIAITAMEFDLLRAFAEHPNRVLSRDQLLDMAHNRGWEPFDRSIDIRIARLRRKVEPDPAKPQVIKTVRGAGYMFSL